MPRIIAVIFALLFVQLCDSQQVIPTSINFDNANMFYDLSMYNFAQGNLNIYTFAFNARDNNHKVHLYLYQNMNNQAVVQVFDGPDTNARQITVAPFNPSTDGALTRPKPIVSTGRTLFVRLYADLLNLKNSEDFQAMVTDFEQPAGCADMVYSTNQQRVFSEALRLNAAPQQCIYVLHANDPLNNPSLTQSFIFPGTAHPVFKLYKGLTISAVAELDTDNRAVWAYDKHLLVVPTSDVTAQFGWDYSDLHMVIHMTSSSNQRGTIMTQDFLQDNYPNNQEAFQQNITVTKTSDMGGIGIEYKQLLGLGVIRVAGYVMDQLVNSQMYSAGNLPSNMVYFYDRLEIQYNTGNSINSGFYALYYDPTDYTKVSTTRVTSRPIPTTTKSGMMKFNAFPVILSVFSVFHILH